MTYKLGSLFDGSGGFPLAGSLCGIEPVWAAEVEPYPIAVTRSRFPAMKHLGDISKINGGEIEPVDIITFGSPCQDLSVAGKRAGLKHEANGDEETTRSGLFMEAVRIIKEMREKTNGRYPTFALWENVPGAFSSNKGEDFRIVCEELIKIVEPSAFMPPVPKNGWAYADSYCGDGWSLAYRVFDAQYWGVPQRRRRIHLVLDLRGERAREVLFEREGVRGYFAEGRTPWQAVAGDAQSGSGADDRAGNCVGFLRQLSGVEAVEELSPTLLAAAGERGNNKPCVAYGIDHAITTGGNCTAQGPCVYDDVQATLKASGTHAVAYSFDSLASNSMKSSNPHSGCRQVEVSKCLDTTDPNPSKNQGGIAIVEPAPPIYAIDKESWTSGQGFDRSPGITEGGPCPTLQTSSIVHAVAIPVAYKTYDARGNGDGDTVSTITGDHENRITDYTSVVVEPIAFAQNQRDEVRTLGDKAGACQAQPGMKQQTFIAQPTYCLQGNGIDRADTAGCNGKGWTEDKSYTLNTIDRPAVVYALDRAAFNQGSNAKYDPEITENGINSTLVARGPSAVAYEDNAFALTTGSFMQVTEEVSPTLMARDWKDPTCVAVHYIVRRLTPTECARLQGFADRWGDIEPKEDFAEEEYRFWLEVRNTHATVIGGKEAKEYTKAQMLTWYSKLHTDSAEYKMWGNGIALPPALYCLQGITDALKEYGNEPVVEKFDMEKAVEEIDHSPIMLAYARIWKNRKRLTRQQMKTLKGQIKAGDAAGAMRGLDKLLKDGKA